MAKGDDSAPHLPDLPPPAEVPAFYCPSCEVPLHYVESRPNGQGDSAGELSDFYRCPAGCGMFEYERHRHRMRLVEAGYAPGSGGA
jgi:hypothetical protein